LTLDRIRIDGDLLDICNNEAGGDERVLRKAIDLSKKD